MKKTKFLGIVCLLLVILCCLTACGDNGYNAKKAKTVTITATLNHPDGTLLQKIESTFTKQSKGYSYVTKNTTLNTLDSSSTEMYTTEETSGDDNGFAVPSWVLDDLSAIYKATETEINGLVKAEKIAELGIDDAQGDVTVTLQLDGNNLLSMTISYTNTNGATVEIVAQITY